MKSEEYINKLISQVRWEKAHPMIEEEIRQHIEDEKEKYIKFGKDEKEAEELAVKQMGNPVDVGKQLDEVHRPMMAWDVVVMTLAAAVVGLIVQFALMKRTDFSSFMPNPLRGMVTFTLGLIVMMGICMLDYTRIGRHAKAIYILCSMLIILLEIINQGFPIDLGIDLPIFFNINLGFLMLLLIPLYGAVLYRFKGSGYKGLLKGMLYAVPYMLAGLMSLSVSTCVISWFSCGFMLILAVVKNWFEVPKKRVIGGMVLCMGALPVMGIYGLMRIAGVSHREYIVRRIDVWLHPYQADPDHSYGKIMLDFIMQNKWVGMNPLLRDDQWSDRLPKGFDFGLTYLAAYYGILAALIVVLVIGILFVRTLVLSVRQKNPMGMMMSAGASLALMIQFVFSVLVNVGLIPSIGYCPFITYGGTGMMVTCILIGILLSVYRYQNVVDEVRVCEGRINA